MKEKEWFDIRSPKAFSSGKSAREKEVLSHLLAYQTSRKRFKNFRRRGDLASFFGVRWQMDLADVGGSKAFNFPATEKREKRYALLVVDIFSRYVFARGIPSKKGQDVVDALKDILTSLKSPFPKKPSVVQSDEGGEFKNDKVKSFFAAEGIEHRFERGRLKDVVVERVIREFKKLAVLYLESKPKAFNNWNEVVLLIAGRLNEARNRNLKMSPQNALKEWPTLQRLQIRKMNVLPFNRYLAQEKNLLKDSFSWKDAGKKFFLNRWVLTPHEKTSYEKETVRNYTYKPWKIVGVSMDRIPFLYTLRDAKGKKAPRQYYAKELRTLPRVPLKGRLPLAGILAERVKKGKKQWLARFVDHEPSFDKWIPERKKGFPPERDVKRIPKTARPIKQTSQIQGARSKKS